jgi:hypothetical protein
MKMGHTYKVQEGKELQSRDESIKEERHGKR